MTSNKLSTRRGMLLRPKVCKSIPKINQISAASFPTCYLTLDKYTVHQNDHVEGVYFGCLLCEPQSNPIKVVPTATAGEFNIVGTPMNCYPCTVQYDAYVLGVQTLTCEGTWFNGALCVASVQVTVIP